MEVVQNSHHMVTGRYLAYASPDMLNKGRSPLLELKRHGSFLTCVPIAES